MSAKTGVPPANFTAFAVAINVNDGTITSSPSDTPIAFSAATGLLSLSLPLVRGSLQDTLLTSLLACPHRGPLSSSFRAELSSLRG